MFGSFLVNMAAHIAGLSDKQLSTIEAAMPATRKLIAVIIKAQPLIEKVAPIVDEMSPLIAEGMPLVKQAAEEIQVVGPALEIILDAIEKQTASGQSRDEAIASIHQTLSRIEGWA